MKYLTLLIVFFSQSIMANQCIELVQKEDFYEAADVCKKMADKGDRNAQFALAVMNYQGSGMMSDLAKSQKLMRMAAEQNHSQAQFNLGIMLANGHGSNVNLVEAFAWLKISADNGYSAATDSVKQLGEELSSKEKKKADEKINELKTKFKL